MDNDDIAIASGWNEVDAEKWVMDLMFCGFIDHGEDGPYLHDWEENNPWAAGAEGRSEKAKKAAIARHAKRDHAQSNATSITEQCHENDQAKLDDKSSFAPPPSPSPYPSPSEDSGGGGAHDASANETGGTVLQPTVVEANRIIAHFQAVREELWPRCPNLTSPTMTLRDQATAFLNLGGTVPLINEMLERGMRTAAAKGKTATVSLKAFQNSITDAIADHRAGIQSQGGTHATAPRRASQPRSFADEVRAIDQAVSASRSHRLEPSGMAPVEHDGKVIEGEFSAL